MGRFRTFRIAALLLGVIPSSAVAQSAAQVEAERAAWRDWLATSAVSPLVAISQQPVGQGLTLGPDTAQVPLAGVGPHVVTARGTITLSDGTTRRALPRGRAVPLGGYVLVGGGAAGRAMLTVFDTARARRSPAWYPINPAVSYVGPLLPPDEPGTERLLAPDGIEVVATRAGAVVVPVGDSTMRLTVMRLPDPATGEETLEIFFRDGTNDDGTYPAGRFVALQPVGNNRYRLDFNRARNPFCAYSVAYACPAPWRGNTLPLRMEAGERYVTGS